MLCCALSLTVSLCALGRDVLLVASSLLQDPKEYAQVLEKIDAMRAKTLASANATLHSITDYSMCKTLDSCSPCCNAENVGCRCEE